MTIPLIVMHGLDVKCIELRNIDMPIDSITWPSSVYEISIDAHKLNGWNYPIQQHLPRTLQILRIYAVNFNCPLNDLPPSLRMLDISSSAFNHSLDNLPADLIMLRLKNAETIIRKVPNNLSILCLRDTRSLKVKRLPPLKILEFRDACSQSFTLRLQSKTIQRLQIGNIKITF